VASIPLSNSNKKKKRTSKTHRLICYIPLAFFCGSPLLPGNIVRQCSTPMVYFSMYSSECQAVAYNVCGLWAGIGSQITCNFKEITKYCTSLAGVGSRKRKSLFSARLYIYLDRWQLIIGVISCC